MLHGDTILNDGVLGRTRPTLEQLYDAKQPAGIIMGWDIEDTYWIKTGMGGEVIRSANPGTLVHIRTTETAPTAKDNSEFICDQDHLILCGDGKFHPIKEVVVNELPIQHVRGNGHCVHVMECHVRVLDDGYTYGIKATPMGCYIHNMTIHAGEPS